MKKIYFLWMAMVTVLSMNLPAQEKPQPVSSTLNGVILDEQQHPVDYATIGLFRQADSALVKTALSGSDGKFELLAVNPGTYYLKVSLMGFKPYKGKPFNLALSSAVVNLGTIQLLAEGKVLKTVNITAVKPLIERKTDKLVMNVENSSVAIGSTALEVLQKAPGVSVDHNDNISMQGKQGVLILLDGKSTYMSNADVANLLRNMPSDQLESIELITNPSSKYDASGNSGIINIKTKKNRNGGTNGSLSTSIAAGRRFRTTDGINLNHRTNNLNVFGNYFYGHYGNNNMLDIDRISNGLPDTYFMQIGNTLKKRTNNNFKAGIDFFLDKKNTLGILVNGYYNTGVETADNKTQIGSSFSQVDSLLMANSIQDDQYKGLSYNLNYKSVLDSAGSEISADLDYSRYTGNDISRYENDYRFTNGSSMRPLNVIRNTTPTQIDIRAFKIDYNVALNKTLKLEAGIKSSWVKTDNDLRAEEMVNSTWQNDVRRSNQFVYDENVNAAYANLNKQFEKFSIQLGLRMEQTHSKGNLITTNNVVKRSYIDFFPTVFVQHTLSDNHQLGLSYSRRIDRPGYDALNPFVYYLDQYTYNQGNPFLNPQYTDNMELSYTLKQKYMISVNYSYVHDVIAQVLLPNEGRKALYQTNANLAKNISYGANVNIPVKVAKWWSMNNNLNAFHLSFDAPDLAGRHLKSGRTSFQFKMQNSFTLGKGLNAELMASYESPLDYGTISLEERYSMDIGISKSLLNKKASLKLGMSDVFNTNATHLSSAYPGLKYTLYQKNDTQMAKLSFTYRFGKNEIKPARRRTTGTEDEQGRIKN